MELEKYLNKPIPPFGTTENDDWEPGDAVECGEPVVDITVIHPRIAFDASYLNMGIKGALTHCYVRQGVYNKLLEALDNLAEEYSFLIYDTLRPLRVQKALYDDYYEKVKAAHPDGDADIWEHLTREFVALPVMNLLRPSTHQTGGAVDLTLCKNGRPLDMGTVFDDFRDIAHTDWFEQEGMDETVRLNRRLLHNVMLDVGFTNYESEWWHYDWGNRSWARKNRCASIYTYSDSPELI